MRTPLGIFHVAALNGAVVHCGLPNLPRSRFVQDVQKQFPSVTFMERQAEPILETAASQLVEYSEGRRTSFTVPLHTTGTEFQRKVWNVLSNIPYGQVRSYAEVAKTLGKPGASRAVGQANNRNPVAPFIPCHRVVAASGGLGGYGGGIALKKRMLEMEGVRLG